MAPRVPKHIDALLGETRQRATYLHVTRDRARTRAVSLIRHLGRSLRDALDGDTLRGLPNLVVSARSPLQGVQIRSIQPHRSKYEAQLPDNGAEVLILDKRGWLSMARRERDGGWSTRRAIDEEIQAQDLEPYTRAVQHVLETYRAKTERRTANYEQISQFAEKLAAAIGFTF